MNRKIVLGAALTVAVAVGTTVGADLASAAPTTHPATTVAETHLGNSHFLPLGLALRAADAAVDACKAKGYPVSVTVLDRDGIVIAQERADNATGATVAVSEEKAYAAVGFQAPSGVFQQLATTQPGFTAIPGFVILPGGLPIAGGGSVIAGIGVSGAPTGDIDQTCATAGIAAIS